MECTDNKCAIHGSVKVRGNVFTGVVVSAKPMNTVTIERYFTRKIAKYERFAKEKSKIYAHNPSCINAKEHDIVVVGETRRLSKTKAFVVLEKKGKALNVKGEDDIKRKKTEKEGKEK